MKDSLYNKGFKDGWEEAVGWINGEIDLLLLPNKYQEAIKTCIAKWLPEWRNSVQLKRRSK